MTDAPIVRALKADEAAAHTAEWRALAERALEPNAFYEPAVSLAALRHLNPSAHMLMVWMEGRLVAVWPVRWHRRRYGAPFRLMAVEQSYAPITTPLLDAAYAERAAGALLTWVRDQGAAVLLVPKLSDEGPAAQALADAARGMGAAIAKLKPHRRAAIFTADHIAVSSKQRREHDRMRRKLAEGGEVSLTVAREPAEVAAALDEFLELERTGWKGRFGNPLAANAGERAFMVEAASGLVESGGMRVVLLRVGLHAVAGGLVLTSGRRAFYFKTAYDEARAKASPGTLITYEIARMLVEDEAIDSVDSLADPGHPLMDRVWHGRIAIADWMIGLHGDTAEFRLLVALERSRTAARAFARRVKFALRR